MEKQIFDWVGFDVSDTMVFCFTDVSLNVDLAPHKKGDKFACASLNYEDGTLALYDSFENEEPVYHGKLKLSVEP